MLELAYPWWSILLCAGAGVLAAVILYAKEKRAGKWQSITLGILRALFFSLIAFLLLQPVIKYFDVELERPVVILAADKSHSMWNHFDSTSLSGLYEDFYKTLEDEDEYELVRLSFANETHESSGDSITGDLTDMSSLFRFISDRYSDREIAAISVLSDGNINTGRDPSYMSDRLAAPVFPVIAGDTTPLVNAAIDQILYNEIVYLGDGFELEVDIKSTGLQGKSSTLRLEEITHDSRRTLGEKSITLAAEDHYEIQSFRITPEGAGIHTYRITLSPVTGEETTVDNYRTFYVNVLDNRQEVLLVYSVPHPDIQAVRTLLEGTDNYNLTVSSADDFQPGDKKFDIAILHQIPSRNRRSDEITNWVKAEDIPAFYIAGAGTDLQGLEIINYDGDNRRAEYPEPRINPGFAYFSLSDELETLTDQLPPLNSAFGTYSLAAEGDILFYQNIGSVEMDYPLLLFGKTTPLTGVLTGTGIWRWKLFDYMQNNSTDGVRELLTKSLQYLAVQSDKRRLRVRTSSQLYYTAQEVRLSAELYNPSYEKVTGKNISLRITNVDDNSTYNYTFSEKEDHYVLNAGKFPEGNYRYTAAVADEPSLTDAGGFTVVKRELENLDRRADPESMRRLAGAFGGEVIYADRLNTLEDIISNYSDPTPVSHSTARTDMLLDLWWIVLIIIVLMGMEWFLRRVWIGY